MAKGKEQPRREVNWPGKYAPYIRCGCGSDRVYVRSLVERLGGPVVGHHCECADCGAAEGYRIL